MQFCLSIITWLDERFENLISHVQLIKVLICITFIIPLKSNKLLTMECADFLQFQDTLKKMRDLDDKIVYALNVKVPTPSFRNEINPAATCKELFNELESNYTKREQSIRSCITITSERIKELKENKNSAEDLSLQKTLSKEQTKLRLLKNELLVEEVVKDRSLKVYYERCREYYKPPISFSL